MQKILRNLSLLGLVIFSVTFMSFALPTGNGEIKLTPRELNGMSIEKLTRADAEYPLESCVITVGVGKDIWNFTITGLATPKELKKYFKTIKPGQKFVVQSRLAKVNGSSKKLPALVYAIVEKQ
jgi:hypothetical protein